MELDSTKRSDDTSNGGKSNNETAIFYHATFSSKTSVNFDHTTRRSILKDSSFHTDNIFGKVYPKKQSSS
jgi:hypothetical protein